MTLMKNFYASMMACTILLLAVGCSKDNEAPLTRYVIDSGRRHNIDRLSWLFLSDEKGKPLHTVESNEFFLSASYGTEKGSPYWATVVEYFPEYEMIYLNTIRLVDGIDTFKILPKYPPDYTEFKVRHGLEEGDAYIDISALNYSHNITVGTLMYTDYLGAYSNVDQNLFSFSLQNGDMSDCYVSITNYNEYEPKYWFAENVTFGDTIFPDPANFKEYDMGFDLQLEPFVLSTRQVIGINDTSEEAYCVFHSKDNFSPSGKYPVRYLNSFDSYQTYLEYFLDKEYLENVIYTEVSDRPLNSFDKIENSFSADVSDVGEISYSYSGDAVLSKWVWYGVDPVDSWSLLSDVNENDIIRPTIPEEITRQLPTDKSANFRFNNVAFYSYSFLDSYHEYVHFNSSGESFPREYNTCFESFTNKN